MARKLKHVIEFLGVYDVRTGEPVLYSRDRHVKWMADNCKGKWRYYSPDARLPPATKKSDDWPTFYTMRFSFARKIDFEAFLKEFI